MPKIDTQELIGVRLFKRFKEHMHDYDEWMLCVEGEYIVTIDENFRKKGIGSQLLKAAEDEARKRGCHSVHVDTMSWQALDFYKKHGYKIISELNDIPKGNKKYHLIKELNDL